MKRRRLSAVCEPISAALLSAMSIPAVWSAACALIGGLTLTACDEAGSMPPAAQVGLPSAAASDETPDASGGGGATGPGSLGSGRPVAVVEESSVDWGLLDECVESRGQTGEGVACGTKRYGTTCALELPWGCVCTGLKPASEDPCEVFTCTP